MTENLQLWMSHDVAERIRNHGAETFPYECCGALLGHDSEEAREVLQLFPLVNRRDDSPRNRFSVTPEDVLAAEKMAREQGLEVVGWYHSHPDHPARPSEYDRDHAWPWYSYVLVGGRNGSPAETASVRLGARP